MKQKVIFFDADGTIVDGDYMSPDTKQVLMQLATKGNILVLSTGRASHYQVGFIAAVTLSAVLMAKGIKDMTLLTIIATVGSYNSFRRILDSPTTSHILSIDSAVIGFVLAGELYR